FITHPHMDHIGGLSTLQFFVQYMMEGVFFEVVVHDKLKDKVLKYFEVAGNDLSKFEIKTISEDKEYKLHSNFMIKAYETNHIPREFASGLLVRDGIQCYYYSGDSNNIPDPIIDILERGYIKEFYQDITVNYNVEVHAYYAHFIRKYKNYFERTKLFFYHQDKFTLDPIDNYGVRITSIEYPIALESLKSFLECNVSLSDTKVFVNADKTSAFVEILGGSPSVKYLFDCRYGDWEFIGYSKLTSIYRSTHAVKSINRVRQAVESLGLKMGTVLGVDIRSDISSGLSSVSMGSPEPHEIELAIFNFGRYETIPLRVLPTTSSNYMMPASLGKHIRYTGMTGYEFEPNTTTDLYYSMQSILAEAKDPNIGISKGVYGYTVDTDAKELSIFVNPEILSDKEVITLDVNALVEGMNFAVTLKRGYWGCVGVDRERTDKPVFKLL
ncbi:MAG: MBL fold metallo-hydrolase, partial [Paraclostridium sp.]